MTAVTEQPPQGDDALRRFLPLRDILAQTATPEASAKPTVEELAERRHIEDEARREAAKLKEKRRLRRNTVLAMAAIIAISMVITYVGSTNSHDLLIHHHTPDRAAWLLYPAVEAMLVVEIQIGGLLAEYKRSVAFWGTALRAVTAGAAVTLGAAGPAEVGDIWGAFYHALGPVVQFFLAEFLAHARPQFRAASDDIEDRAAGGREAVRPSDERKAKPSRRRTGKVPSAARPLPDGRTKPADEPTSAPAEPSAPVDEKDLLVRAHAAADELARTDQRLNRDNLVRAIRAGGGTIQNKDAGRILAQVRAERGGPDLHPVRQKGA